MSFLGRVMNGLNGAMYGFREGYLNADTPDADVIGPDFDTWGRYEARRLRYALAWAYYQNTAYRDLHVWARQHKVDYSLYKHTRNVYNPINRLAEFHSVHIFGGLLDHDAGDGKRGRTAIPIETTNSKIRPALGQLWQDSRWSVHKTILGRYGSLFGDIGIRAVADAKAGTVRMEVVHPKHIAWADPEPNGRLKGYILEEQRFDDLAPDPMAPVLVGIDPRTRMRLVTYTERVTIDGNRTVFETFKNGDAYPWPGNPGKVWDVPYGFAPLVLIQHVNAGLEWGLGEPHALQAKVREVDDLASKTHDQIRKTVEARWLFTGVKKSDIDLAADARKPTPDRPEPGRAEAPAIYLANENAKATAMVAHLDLQQAIQAVQRMLEEIERDCPELAMDIWRTSEPNARAMRLARQRAEGKLQDRRTGYDLAMAEIQKMALAMGARGAGGEPFPGYEGLPTDVDSPKLKHRVGDRPVFAVDAFDRLDEEEQFWKNAGLAVLAGIPLSYYLEREGWSDEDLAELLKRRVAEAAEPVPVGEIKTGVAMRESGTIAPEDVKVGDPGPGGKGVPIVAPPQAEPAKVAMQTASAPSPAENR